VVTLRYAYRVMLLMCYLGISVFCLVPGAGVTAAAEGVEVAVVNLQTSTTLPAKRDVLLRDVAEISGPDRLVADLGGIVIGRAPLPGYTRGIHIGYIKVRLRQAGIDENSVRFVFEEPTLQVTTANMGTADSGKLQGSKPPAASREREEMVHVLVALQDIDYRDRLSSDLFTSRQVGRDRAASAMMEPVDWECLRAARFIAAGDILKQDACERIPAVERGTQVWLVVHHHGIVVKTRGIALTSGDIGEAVDVANGSSGKRMQGLVVAEQIVEVKVL